MSAVTGKAHSDFCSGLHTKAVSFAASKNDGLVPMTFSDGQARTLIRHQICDLVTGLTPTDVQFREKYHIASGSPPC